MHCKMWCSPVSSQLYAAHKLRLTDRRRQPVGRQSRDPRKSSLQSTLRPRFPKVMSSLGKTRSDARSGQQDGVPLLLSHKDNDKGSIHTILLFIVGHVKTDWIQNAYMVHMVATSLFSRVALCGRVESRSACDVALGASKEGSQLYIKVASRGIIQCTTNIMKLINTSSCIA